MFSERSGLDGKFSPYPVPPQLGTSSSLNGENRIKPLSALSKCAIAALAVGFIAGMILMGLGGMQTFGSTGSPGFIASIGGGGVLTAFSAGGLFWVVRKRPVDVSHNADESSVIQELKKNLEAGLDISRALQSIPMPFFENKSQERSKAVFSTAMQEVLGAEVIFPRSGPLEDPENLEGELDPEVFQLSRTDGVEEDIPRSSKDKHSLHVYQVASQYNASEAPNPFTPGIGQAMKKSSHDHTQGPLAQRTNPIAFELVTAFLTHLGFNMLNEVLPSAGKTYESEAVIEHGYLRPDDENLHILTNEFRENFSKAEYVCYSSFPRSWSGAQPVYLFLQAAPAMGYSNTIYSTDELQKYAALANFLALFRQGIQFARDTGHPVVLHAAAVGCGVFGNETKNFEWGFEKAALALQGEMKSVGVSVQLEAYGGKGPMTEMANHLNIPLRERIGD